MRDDHRLREKIELSLDDRQVAALVVCALLLLGGVFTLGVLIGKQLTGSAARPTLTGDLAALDAQAAEHEPTRRAATAKSTATPVRAATTTAKPTTTATANPTATPNPTPTATPNPTPTTTRNPTATPNPTANPRVETPLSPVERATPEKSTAKPVIELPGPKPQVTLSPPPSPLPELPPPPPDVGRFTVQVGASQDRAEAQRLASRAGAAGLRAYVTEAHLGEKGIWYRVRVGAFPDRDAADRYRRDVERELRLSAVVMPAR